MGEAEVLETDEVEAILNQFSQWYGEVEGETRVDILSMFVDAGSQTGGWESGLKYGEK